MVEAVGLGAIWMCLWLDKWWWRGERLWARLGVVLMWAYLPRGWPSALFTRRARRHALPGHRAGDIATAQAGDGGWGLIMNNGVCVIGFKQLLRVLTYR